MKLPSRTTNNLYREDIFRLGPSGHLVSNLNNTQDVNSKTIEDKKQKEDFNKLKNQEISLFEYLDLTKNKE